MSRVEDPVRHGMVGRGMVRCEGVGRGMVRCEGDEDELEEGIGEREEGLRMR